MESPDEMQARWNAEITAAGVMTEEQMRDSVVPTPNTPEELSAYIAKLTDRPHDYGTCVYAMSMAATAAFNFVARKLQVTGFQASCADMDILTRTRSMKGPWMILKGEDALYPQYDLPGRLAEAMEDWKPWLGEQARAKLAETNGHAADSVKAHWEKLAAYPPAPSE